eukprot:6312018-Alexandrium_andersonii.AAC.1
MAATKRAGGRAGGASRGVRGGGGPPLGEDAMCTALGRCSVPRASFRAEQHGAADQSYASGGRTRE